MDPRLQFKKLIVNYLFSFSLPENSIHYIVQVYEVYGGLVKFLVSEKQLLKHFNDGAYMTLFFKNLWNCT